MTTCSHPIPVEAPLRPSPLSSPSNEQAHHMRLLRPCRYDCEQNDLVDEENCGSFNCGLRIADISHRATEKINTGWPLSFCALLCVSVALWLISAIRNSLRFAYPYVRAVVGIQAEL